MTTPITPEAREAVCKATADLDWTIDDHHSVVTPDGRTVPLNGFASLMAGGATQDAARARTRAVVDAVAAIPAYEALVQALEDEKTLRACDVASWKVLAEKANTRATAAEAEVARLRDLIERTCVEMEASGGWAGDEDLFADLMAALAQQGGV